MDHGRFGPPGVLGGTAGAPNVVRIHRGVESFVPEHLSKDQDIAIGPGDRVEVMTPGGGGYGDPFARDPALVARDVRRGYYTREEAEALWGVVLTREGAVDKTATAALRAPPPLPEGKAESATADRVRGYGLSGEGVPPHPVHFADSTSPSGRGGA